MKLKQSNYFNGDINPYDPALFKSWAESLETQIPQTVEELEEFIQKVDELNHKIQDAGAEIYIKMTCNTADEQVAEDYIIFQKNISAYYSYISSFK